ncbi:unnamed protein product [Pedinophyceae sp. YPF-701]|nr:unnamed protein product [Pedinophyceae sp. YPF-701]
MGELDMEARPGAPTAAAGDPIQVISEWGDAVPFKSLSEAEKEEVLAMYADPAKNHTGLVLVRESLMLNNGTASHKYVWGEQEQLTPGQTVFVFYTTIIFIVLAQLALVQWRKRHKRSYDVVSLIGLWFVPFGIAIRLGFVRFILVWLAYSAATGFVLYLSTRKPLAQNTPRLAYTWFIGTYNASVLVGSFGIALMFGAFIGFGPLEFLVVSPNTIILLEWYGCYFGVVTRDCAELAGEIMASTMGSGGRRLATSVNRCGVCSRVLAGGALRPGDELEERSDPTVTLPCRHRFHEMCVKGWLLVGKKDTCPTCLEKVDLRGLRSLNSKPWDRGSVYWSQLLDMVRYLVVFNPVIFWVINVFFYEIGIFKHL